MLTDELSKAASAAVDARMAIREGAQIAVAVLTPGAEGHAQLWARRYLEKYAPNDLPTAGQERGPRG